MSVTIDGTNGVTTPDVEVSSGGSASTPAITVTGDTNTGIFFPAADTIAFAEGGAEAMRITSDGRLGIGTSSPSSKLHVAGSSGDGLTISGSGATGVFRPSAAGVEIGSSSGDNTVFLAGSASEKARITTAGRFVIGATTADHFFQATNDSTNISTITAQASSGSYADYNIFSNVNRNTTNNSYYHLRCRIQGVADKLLIADSGNVTNTNNSYGSISDVKLKQDIVDAGSQWDDIKGLRVRKYRWKSDPDGFMQMGLVAQEAELVSPGLIDEHPDYEEVEVTDEEGNVTTQRQSTGTTTKAIKYSVLYMKAFKALQEAMERIETLESKVAALEANNV